MDKGRFSRIYSLVKWYTRFSIKRFYRRWQIAGYEGNVRKGVPIIFVPNHQNALIDPLNTCCSTQRDRQPTFLTRSDVFVSWALPAMNTLKMLPIYRQRDGMDSLEKNKAIFEECVDRLVHNESLIIFPEGNHARRRKLRPLKKGAARIAFQAAEAAKFDFPLEIVPVGLNYQQHRKYHNDMLVVYGEPIQLADYYELYHQNQGKAILQLTKDIRKRLSQYMVHIMDPTHYDTINGLRTILSKDVVLHNGQLPSNLYHQLLAEKEIITVLEEKAKSDAGAVEQLGPKVEEYLQGLQRLKFRDHVIAKGPYSMGVLLLQAIGFMLGLPLHLYGVINNYHIYKASEQLTLKTFKDDHFHSSIMMVSGMVLFPLSYLVQFGIVWAFTDFWIGLAYLVSLPFSGEFAIWYSEQFKKWWSRWKFTRLNRKDHSLLKRLKELRQEFSQTILGWLTEEQAELDQIPKK